MVPPRTRKWRLERKPARFSPCDSLNFALGMRDLSPPHGAAWSNPQRARRRFLAEGLASFSVMTVPHAVSAKPASSRRSQDAVARRLPQLGKDLKHAGLAPGAPVFLRIVKQDAILEAFVQSANGKFICFRRYPICTFSGTLGPKLRVGDGQAPEGFYAVNESRMNPYSSYHLSFDLGYPNAYDRNLGRTGSALMVHGNCVSIGCYAMGDEAIEEIWTLMETAFNWGQKVIRVHAFPFVMIDANMKAHAKDANADFWANLKEGWDWFETNKKPPDVKIARGRYVFSTA